MPLLLGAISWMYWTSGSVQDLQSAYSQILYMPYKLASWKQYWYFPYQKIKLVQGYTCLRWYCASATQKIFLFCAANQLCLTEKCWSWLPLIFIGFIVMKITALSSWFQRQNWFWKYATGPKVLAKMSPNMQMFGLVT